MSYRPVPFRSFAGGLQLRDQPDVVDDSQCVDCLNVYFSERGALKQREGYNKLSSSELTNRGGSLEPYYKTDGTKQLLIGAGTRLEALATTGSIVASATGLTDGTWDFARFGSPNSELAYAGQGTDTLRKWDGSSWTAPTATVDGTAGRAMPKAGCLAVVTPDNRLVASGFVAGSGGPNGTTSSPSHVYFSEAGDPEGWNSSNYVQLRPGDGERVMGVCAWRGHLFVFKETAFWVYAGTGTAQTGTPIFNFRGVETGVGLASKRALAVAEDGVYFMDRTGVYRTTGAEPQRVSELVSPIFEGNPNLFYESDTLDHAAITAAAMGYWNRRILLAFPSGAATTNNRLLVFDPTYNWWALWDIPAAALTGFRIGSTEELVFAYASGTKHIGRHVGRDNTYAADDMTAGAGGNAITARWRSGWQNYGSGEVKAIRESKLWGGGQVTLRLYVDYESVASAEQALTLTTGSSDTWGDGTGTDTWGDGTGTDLWGPSLGTIRPYLVRKAARGTVFSTQFRNTTLGKTFSIYRLAHHLRESRVPSTVQTEA
jgi:hypothetical protein